MALHNKLWKRTERRIGRSKSLSDIRKTV